MRRTTAARHGTVGCHHASAEAPGSLSHTDGGPLNLRLATQHWLHRVGFALTVWSLENNPKDRAWRRHAGVCPAATPPGWSTYLPGFRGTAPDGRHARYVDRHRVEKTSRRRSAPAARYGWFVLPGGKALALRQVPDQTRALCPETSLSIALCERCSWYSPSPKVVVVS